MIDKFLISKVRVKILKLFLLNSQNTYHVREIVRRTNEEINAVRRILKELEDIKFLTNERNGNRLYYKINIDFIYFFELNAMFNKEFGLGQKIIKHKNKLGNIKTAFLTKTYIQNKRKNDNDIDLVLVGNSINYIYLDKLIKEFEDANERSINYTYLTQTEFEEYKRSNNYFLSNVIFKEKIVLIGEESLIYT